MNRPRPLTRRGWARWARRWDQRVAAEHLELEAYAVAWDTGAPLPTLTFLELLRQVTAALALYVACRPVQEVRR